MLVKLDCDEWWPVYTLTERSGRMIEMPDELAARLRVATAEFQAVQDLIEPLFGEGDFYDLPASPAVTHTGPPAQQ